MMSNKNPSSTSQRQSKTLIVCDVQPDVVRKLPQPRKFVDLIHMAVQAARASTTCHYTIIYTLLQFNEPAYVQVPPSHPRLGILRRLASKNNSNAITWFMSGELSITPLTVGAGEDGNTDEAVVKRTTYLPHANDDSLMKVLRNCCCTDATSSSSTTPKITLVGYGPTVQSFCHLLGDVLAVPQVQILKECVGDEKESRCQALLEHGLLFDEQVVSLVDFLEENDLLHTRITDGVMSEPSKQPQSTNQQTPSPKYVCDCNRGGHLTLYMPYLLRDYGYVEWPTQPWYQDITKNTQFYCPLGRCTVDLCDEPQFSRSMRFFLAGRQHFDEKDLLHQLVPEFMPPTFDSIAMAQAYYAAATTNNEQDKQKEKVTTSTCIWFIKAVNENGGRAVRVTTNLSKEPPLSPKEQIQIHVPRPLLYDGQLKCHVKTYQYISCSNNVWQVYMHDLFYLATASRPWSVDDLSDAAQITTMRTHRLYPDNAFRKRWNVTQMVHDRMQTLMERAVQQGKLETPPPPTDDDGARTMTTPQFEVNSADWMLDQDGRLYLIECNGIPVLYDPKSPQKQALVTKGLNLYDKLYKQDPIAAVVNDTDLIREALGLALTGKLPSGSLWKLVATIPVPAATGVDKTMK